MIILGSSSLQHTDAKTLYSFVSIIANDVAKPEKQDWRVLNMLHRVASQVGALDVGYKGGIGDLSRIKFLYLLGAVSGCG